MKNFCILLMALNIGCSDFYTSGTIHSASIASDMSLKKREIQATRKSQILFNNQSHIIMIARYLNDIDSALLEGEKGEVFIIEIYDKFEKLDIKNISFVLKTAYTELESSAVTKLNANSYIKQDISYNSLYKVSFKSLGARGRDSLVLEARIKGLGTMAFNYGYAKIKSNLNY